MERLTTKIEDNMYACGFDREDLIHKLGQLEDIEQDLGIELTTLLTILTKGCWAKCEFEEPKFYKPSLIRIHRLFENCKGEFYIFFTYGMEMKYIFESERTFAEESRICFRLNCYGFNKDSDSGFALTKEELEK